MTISAQIKESADMASIVAAFQGVDPSIYAEDVEKEDILAGVSASNSPTIQDLAQKASQSM